MRGYLDKDYLKTIDGFLFCVVGNLHPRDRIISYLKYVPSSHGIWGNKKESYSRTMSDYTIPSLKANLAMLAQRHPQYLQYLKKFHTEMSIVPRRYITHHYLPEKKLNHLLTLKTLDSLQLKAIQLVSYLSVQTSIPKVSFGVTGSLLTGIHQATWSDIDLIIYGLQNGWKIKRFLEKTYALDRPVLKRHCGQKLARLIEGWSRKYRVTLREAKEIYKKKWHRGFFKGTQFSISVVQSAEEVQERYEDKIFYPIQIVNGRARITNIECSLFLPSIYGVKFLDPLSHDVAVETLVSYDGFYGGIFNVGDEVLVRGKLEKVIDRRTGNMYHRILIGSLEADGQDYIKLSS